MVSEMLCLKVGRILTGTGGPPIDDGAILVQDGVVADIGPWASVMQPDQAAAVEYTGATAVPGLVDCHTHINYRGDGTPRDEMMEDSDELLVLLGARNVKLALTSGVTTMCDNGARGSTTFAVKEAIRRGYIKGPRLLVSGRALKPTGGHGWHLGGETDGADELRKAVRQLVKEGTDWIKVMATGGSKATGRRWPSYTMSELEAIVSEAHSFGKWVGAHCNVVSGIEMLLDADVDMIVHGNFFDLNGEYSFDDEVAGRIADTGTWLNPTLHVCRSRVWRLRRLAQERGLTAEEEKQLADQERYWEILTDAFQRLLKAGVRLVAGSDSGWSYYPFGQFAQEIDAMAEAGMTPGEALAAGTRLSAEAVGLGDTVGTLEVGKSADLLLVDGDPTEDTAALSRVVAVFKEGREVALA